jgi:DNA-binding MarR family transcriptional regulator
MPANPDSLLGALRRALSAARREYRDELAHLDLTARQAAVLLAIQADPGVGLNGVAEAVAADAPTCSALVDRLVERGLVVRGPDPRDRRRTSLTLTRDARDIAGRIAASRHAAEARIVAAIGPDTALQLHTLLVTLAEQLEHASVGAAR